MNRNNSMLSKVEIMDLALKSYEKECNIFIINDVVCKIFDIDLSKISEIGEGTQPALYDIEVKETIAKRLELDPGSIEFLERIETIKKIDVLEAYLQGKKGRGSEIRRAINQIFGINLDGISSLQHAGISIFSKGQWILREDTDLFVVCTGKQDVEIKVYPTPFFKQKTGLDQPSREFHTNLLNLGFIYHLGVYSYSDPVGKSLSDDLKGRVFSTITKELNGIKCLYT